MVKNVWAKSYRFYTQMQRSLQHVSYLIVSHYGSLQLTQI